MEDKIYNPYNGFVINDEYLEKRPLSQSSLKAFKKSPRHYIKYLTGVKSDREDFLLGNLIDCLTLEPDKFEKTYMEYEPFEKRKNEDKEKWANMCKAATENNLKLVTKEQVQQAKFCVEALLSHTDARTILEAKKNVQMNIKWKHSETNLPIISKIDFDCNVWGQNFIVDLKTSNDCEPNTFSRDIFNYGYNIQAGAYLLGYQKRFFKFPEYLNLVVEKVEPYNVTIMYYDTKERELCKGEFIGLLNMFRRCMDEKAWDKGYEFWLFDMKKFHSVQRPAYYKSHGIAVEE